MVSCPVLMLVPWQMKEPSSLPGLAQPGDEPPTLFVGQKGAAGPIWPVERRDSRVWPVVAQSSRAWPQRAGSAQGTRPSALPGSMVVFGCFSHQPEAPTCHPQRGKPVATGGGGVPKAHRTRVWPAVMAPRLAGLRADDAVASHRAVDGVGPSIEGARTYAHATPRGAVAVLSAFCPHMTTFFGPFLFGLAHLLLPERELYNHIDYRLLVYVLMIFAGRVLSP